MLQARTIRHICKHQTTSLISINVLKYAVQLITLLGCHLHRTKSRNMQPGPHPIYLLKGDNTSSESWLAKGCTTSTTGCELTCLQSALLLDQGAGYHFGCINTKPNIIADSISCIPSECSLAHEFPILLAQASSLNGCGPFLPSATPTSSIVGILLQAAYMNPLTANKWSLITQRRFTTYPGATTLVSKTHAPLSCLSKDATGSLHAMWYL